MFSSEQVHGEICALLIEVLESLKTNLEDFSCVLPSQWVGLISITTTTSNIDPSQRLEQLANRTKVCFCKTKHIPKKKPFIDRIHICIDRIEMQFG